MRPTRSTIALAGGALLGALTGICALLCTAHAEKPARTEVAPSKAVAKQAEKAASAPFVASSSKVPATGRAVGPVGASLALTAPRALTTIPVSGNATRTAPMAASAVAPRAGAVAARSADQPTLLAQAAPQDARPLADGRLTDVVQRGISPFKKGVDVSIKVALAAPASGGAAKFGPAHPVARAK